MGDRGLLPLEGCLGFPLLVYQAFLPVVGRVKGAFLTEPAPAMPTKQAGSTSWPKPKGGLLGGGGAAGDADSHHNIARRIRGRLCGRETCG